MGCKAMRLLKVYLWPLALSAKSGCYVHFGLYGMEVAVSEIVDGAQLPSVKVRRLFFGDPKVLSGDGIEILEHFGINDTDVTTFFTGGCNKLTASIMAGKMRAASRMMTAISPHMVKTREGGVQIVFRFGNTFYTEPVEDMQAIGAVESSYFKALPAGSSRPNQIAFATAATYREQSRSCDFSVMRIADSSADVKMDDIKDNIISWFSTSHYAQGDASALSASNPYSLYNGVRVTYSEIKQGDKWASEKDIPIACAYPAPSFFANGSRGAHIGFGKTKNYNLDVYTEYTLNFKYTAAEKPTNADGKSRNPGVTYEARNVMCLGDSFINAYTLPSQYERGFICNSFDKMPSLSELERMLEYREPRYSLKSKSSSGVKVPFRKAGEPLTREDVDVVACVLLGKFLGNGTDDGNTDADKIKTIIDRGFITTTEMAEIIEPCMLNAMRNSRQVSSKVQGAMTACAASAQTADDGVSVVSPSGTQFQAEDVVFEFFPFTDLNGRDGCYPKLKSVSTQVVSEGAIISVPAAGAVEGRKKKLPVVTLTPDFCDKSWKDVIRGVILPETIVQLEGNSRSGVFSDFNKLEIVDLTACKGLKQIGSYAFSNCPHLHSILLPDVDAKDSYTIHTKAFNKLESLGELKIRAREILNTAFLTVNMYSLDLDAVSVSSSAFKKDISIAGDLIIGKSFKNIGASGMSGLCDGHRLDLVLPEILKLEMNALERHDDMGGTVELGENLSSIGSNALYGWDSVVINSKELDKKGKRLKKLAASTNALRGVGAAKVHAETSFETEALKNIPIANVTYFEGENMSDRRRSAEEYMEMATMFFAQNDTNIVTFLRDRQGLLGDYDCPATELPHLKGVLGNLTPLDADAVAFYSDGIAPRYDKVGESRGDVSDDEAYMDVAVLRALCAITVPVPPNLVSMYSHAGLYAKSFLHTVVYSSETLDITRLKFITADFQTEIYLYLVRMSGTGEAFLLMERMNDMCMASKEEACKHLGVKDEGMIDLKYQTACGFTYTKDDAEEVAPFLMLGDDLLAHSPTLLGNNFSGNGEDYATYVKTILASSVVLRTEDRFVLYGPFNKWKITFDNKKDMAKVHDNDIGITLDAFCKELTDRKGKAPRMLSDPAEFKQFAAVVNSARSSSSTQPSNLSKCISIFNKCVTDTKGKRILPLSKELFDSLTKYGTYIMSAHADGGVLASENNLNVSMDTARRQLMADGLYLQCFTTPRVSKGTQMKIQDIIDGTRVSFRGGKNLTWYRLYDAPKGGNAVATYISGYQLDGLVRHLKSFDFSKSAEASAFDYGKLASRRRLAFDTDSMPVLYDSLCFGSGEDGWKASVGCAIDTQTGRWYLVSDDISAKKGATGTDDATKSSVMGKLMVLFPISNIAFASAMVLGLKSTEVATTKAYLTSLVEDLHNKSDTQTVRNYHMACAELSQATPNKRRIMEYTDFFLASCLG